MGKLTKQYIKYVPDKVFGIVGSGNCIHLITKSKQKGKYVIVPACESVILWDLRRKVKILTLQCEDLYGIVTAVAVRPPFKVDSDNTHVAVGYSEGTVVLYDLDNHTQPIKFNGHKGGISTIAWDPQGMRVASGSEDGEIVLWDMVSEKGIIRLVGHKGKVNKVHFLQTRNILVSCGRDTFIKFWDLDTNFCFYTLAVQLGGVTDFIIIKNDSRLIVGAKDLKCWALNFVDQNIGNEKKYCNSFDTIQGKLKVPRVDGENEEKVEKEDSNEDKNLYMEAVALGTLTRSRTDLVKGIAADKRAIIVHGKSGVLDIYVILDEEESKMKMEKRIRKAKKRARDLNEEGIEDGLVLSDEIKKILPFRAMSNVSGVSVATLSDGFIKMATLHTDNSIALYSSHVSASSKNVNDVPNIQEYSLHLPGHRSEIRGVAVTSFGDKLITTSSDSIKVWDRVEAQAFRTIECEYPLCLLLPPGDRHIVIGTKSGSIQLYDLASGILLDDICAHEANDDNREEGIWALSLTHDGNGFVSGGSDCMVRFWKFELVEDNNGGNGKRLGIIQEKRALKVADQITCLKCCSSGKYLIAATFDLKETVYYMDSLKLLHEFYGKSMPTTCLDFSKDCTMIITGSKDSCIRIFATDFGDQKKLLKNCHQGGVTAVKFIANTHYFFSCGNDGMIKQWDADNFQRITTLRQHFGIVRCMDICPNGKFIVTGGQDRAIRLWNKSDEILVLQDEREEERRIQEEEAGTTLQAPVIAGEQGAEAVRPTRITKETEKAADQLLEALKIYQQQREAGPDAKPHQTMTLVYNVTDPLKFVLLVLRNIKSSELEEAILILPLNLILVLIICTKGFILRKWDTELSTRVLLIAVRTNMPQLLAFKKASPVIRSIANSLPEATREMQDTLGFNYAGLQHMMHRFEKRKENQLFVEAAQNFKNTRRRGKKKEKVIKRALLSI